MNELVAEYRNLAVGSESLHALDATLALVERAIGVQIRVRNGKVAVRAMASWTPHGRSWKQLSDLGHQPKDDWNARHEEGPRPRGGQVADRVRYLRTKWCLTALPRQLAANSLPESQYSFLVDALLLLFHQTYFVLLPRIEEGDWTEERNDLISSFFMFADFLPDIAERFRVAELAHEAESDVAKALASFEKALSASHVDEHVFMTRLQTFWMALLDKGDFRAALDLLLRILPMIPLKHLPELRELIAATFEEYGDARTASGAAG